MNISDIREDITEALCAALPTTYPDIGQISESENAIIIKHADGNRYKLTIEKL